MPTSLVSPLVLATPRHPLATPLACSPSTLLPAEDTEAADEAHQGACAQASELQATQGQGGYGVGYDGQGEGSRGVADPEGGSETQAGGRGNCQEVSLPAAPISLHTQSVSPSPSAPTLTFALPLASLNAHELPFSRATRVKRERLATAWALVAARLPRRPLPSHVTLTRLASRPLDSDNLQGAFKAVRDEVAAFFGVDDGPRGPITWQYGQGYARLPKVSIAFGEPQ